MKTKYLKNIFWSVHRLIFYALMMEWNPKSFSKIYFSYSVFLFKLFDGKFSVFPQKLLFQENEPFWVQIWCIIVTMNSQIILQNFCTKPWIKSLDLLWGFFEILVLNKWAILGTKSHFGSKGHNIVTLNSF